MTAASATVATTATAAATTIVAAATSAAATAATAAVTTVATAAALRAFFTGTCFVNCEGTTEEFLAVEALNRCIHFFYSFHRNESEAAGAARLTVFDDENVTYGSVCFEKLMDITISCVVGQIAYIHLCIHLFTFILLGYPTCFFALSPACERMLPD
jgi:hypothetical protein